MNVGPRIGPTVTAPGEPPPVSDEPIPRALMEHKTAGWQMWLWRIRALLFVTVCATFGVLLIILPWTPKWTDNPLILTSPGLRGFISNGFVRGVASGLGVLDLWLGFWEAIHYHETPKGSG